MKLFFAANLICACCFALGFTPQFSNTITGIVVNENNNPVNNAIVSTAVGTSSTQTDVKGYFKITLPETATTITVTAKGYEPLQVNIKGKSYLKITLKKLKALAEKVKVVEQKNIAVKRVITTNSNYDLALKAAPMPSGYYNEDIGNTESYNYIADNSFKSTANDPLSTFSIDVDAASYSNVRRFINGGQLPPAGAVRTEEMINYFKYNYPQPTNSQPFSINTELAACPWNNQHQLMLIGLQGKNIATDNLPASNLVFLIDVSGSMQSANKLPLVKSSLKLLTEQLRPQDNIAIVVYAGSAGLVLPSTSGAQKNNINKAIDALEAGGSTAGGEGIELAYKVAMDHFNDKGNNRIILCTDGDFNVGASSDDAMARLIENKRKTGVFLTVLGYGMGNYKDSKMQELADKGNGNHAYIDNINEAKKVLVNEFGGTLFTIAKDVKIQVEFNPQSVAGYRLIGYENRLLNKEDFNNDAKDAGELGSGHTVTALYEVVPVGVALPHGVSVPALKYQQNITSPYIRPFFAEMANINFRYKAPDGDESKLITQAVPNKPLPFNEASNNIRFASTVAQFAMQLRSGDFSKMTWVIENATAAMGDDKEGYRKEFVMLAEKVSGIAKNNRAVKNFSSGK
ncbi:von Willebrand factor type A domain-containing protein [Ferruginibacter yonginensis]|uniref:von Willebrand factor type A domain-containing protein n=1 Tax=Ferruginibacter yonginensis TaxID=1310416 RepID=A0ABV8QRS5_9BACT